MLRYETQAKVRRLANKTSQNSGSTPKLNRLRLVSKLSRYTELAHSLLV